MDLDAKVDSGDFLIDLDVRLNGMSIELSPLRERIDEIESHVQLFFTQNGVKVAEKEIDTIVDRCKKYYWRGNVRQSCKALDVLLNICVGNEEPISSKYLPEFKTMLAPNALHTEKVYVENFFKYIVDAKKPHRDSVEMFESRFLEEVIRKHDDPKKAREALKMTKSTFILKRRKYGLLQ